MNAPDKTVEVSQAARELVAAECSNDWARPSILDPASVATWNMPVREALRAVEAALQSTTRATQPEAALREVAQAVLDTMSGTYKARNGREMGIQGDDGEKCWIVHSDQIEDLRAALRTTAILALQSSERGEGLLEAVKAKRRALGWSLRDLEAETGIGFSTLARFERGERIGNRVRAHLTEWVNLSPAEPSPESREEALELLATATGDRGAWLKWYSQSQQASASVLVETALSAIRALKGPQNDR